MNTTINERESKLLQRISDTVAAQWTPQTTKGKNARRLLILLAKKISNRIQRQKINENVV